MSRYGFRTREHGLPAFVYTADQDAVPAAEWSPILAPPTRRHLLAIGNRRLSVVVANDGTASILDEATGLRWWNAPDPDGTGVSVVDGAWGTSWTRRPSGVVPERRFGPQWFTVRLAHSGLELERTLVVPDGETPWVLVRVRLAGTGRVELTEEWALRPRFLSLFGDDARRRTAAEESVRYVVETVDGGVRAVEERLAAAERWATMGIAQVFGPPQTLRLDAVGATRASASHDGQAHPTLRLTCDVELDGPTELWFRFGLDDGSIVDDPASLVADSLARLRRRLPRAASARAPQARWEVPWHAAVLTGGACVDEVLGGHTLDQASAYSYVIGFNGAARDPLQHALPLVYSEPDLALSVLRNTCAWGAPTGELPYALDGAKQASMQLFQPSDQSLWSLWLAAEYAAATGDLQAFGRPVGFHPSHAVDAVPLHEHLRRQLRFLVEDVGFGAHGHLRIRNADWNDAAIGESGAPHDAMIATGESVLNSAMAAWVLPVYAGLCARLGDDAQASRAREVGERLREAVAGDFTGRWFRRAWGPSGPVGEDALWLEVQPWAILCGAATPDVARATLRAVDELCRTGSPVGARVKWPPVADGAPMGPPGHGTNGGMWFAISMTLVWAAAAVDPELAWDEWRRMSLSAHTAAYPEVWEGTLSGPDSYNTPEAGERAGRTWGVGMPIAMQSFPVNNLHAHAQPLLAYLRLLGVEPTPHGTLRVGRGAGSFASPTFAVRRDGSGRLQARGRVVVESACGEVRGGPGLLAW